MKRFVQRSRYRDRQHVQLHEPHVARVRHDPQRGVPRAGALARPGARTPTLPSEVSLLQVISVLGALAVLGAYAANQFGWINPSQLSYTVANFVGAGILTAVAVVDRQIGFVLLQGGWTLVSLWGVFAILRGSESLPGRVAARKDDSRPSRAP